MILTAPSKSIMNTLARSILGLYCYDKNPDDISISNVLRQSIDLTGYFPAIIAYAYQAKSSYYELTSMHLHNPLPELSTAENILRMIRPTGEYTNMEAKLLDISLILHAEHGGGNNSSFTTHVISSSGTDTYAAIAAAVGSLKGPKHGGANIAVINMMNDIKANVKNNGHPVDGGGELRQDDGEHHSCRVAGRHQAEQDHRSSPRPGGDRRRGTGHLETTQEGVRGQTGQQGRQPQCQEDQQLWAAECQGGEQGTTDRKSVV